MSETVLPTDKRTFTVLERTAVEDILGIRTTDDLAVDGSPMLLVYQFHTRSIAATMFPEDWLKEHPSSETNELCVVWNRPGFSANQGWISIRIRSVANATLCAEEHLRQKNDEFVVNLATSVDRNLFIFHRDAGTGKIVLTQPGIQWKLALSEFPAFLRDELVNRLKQPESAAQPAADPHLSQTFVVEGATERRCLAGMERRFDDSKDIDAGDAVDIVALLDEVYGLIRDRHGELHMRVGPGRNNRWAAWVEFDDPRGTQIAHACGNSLMLALEELRDGLCVTEDLH